MQKLSMALAAAVGGMTALGVRKRVHNRNANWLRNDEGVGPAHYRGTRRGEERAVRKND